MKTVTWKCDACKTSVVSEKGPAGWYRATLSARFTGYNGSGSKKLQNKHTVDLCPECTDLVELKIDPERWSDAQQISYPQAAE